MKKSLQIILPAAAAFCLAACTTERQPLALSPDSSHGELAKLEGAENMSSTARRKLAVDYCKAGEKLLKDEDHGPALEEFNRAWQADNTYFGSYWGTGVIRGQQSFDEKNPELQLQYMNECALLLEKARSLAPAEMKAKLGVDLMNIYNTLGAYYKELGDAKQSMEFLDKSSAAGKDFLALHPEDGRVNCLMAYNYYYRGDYHKAAGYLRIARNAGFKVPSMLREELDRVNVHKVMKDK